MLFTLYGDYAIHRGGEVWVGSLVRIAAQFGLSEQAVRSALSRMVRNGWLSVRRPGHARCPRTPRQGEPAARPYYSLTDRSKRLLEEGSQRIFQRRGGPWDGCWHLLAYSIPERQRDLRDHLRKRLAYLGFGALGSGLWISPHPLELQARHLVDSLGLAGHVELFAARHLGFASDVELAARCWDLDEIARLYLGFLACYRPAWEAHQQRLATGEALADSDCFVERFLLVHEYRRFFFQDPELPRELLPPDWPGWEAADLFQAYHALLAEPANRYFDATLKGEG